MGWDGFLIDTEEITKEKAIEILKEHIGFELLDYEVIQNKFLEENFHVYFATEENGKVIGGVVLIKFDDGEFAYKVLTEDMGPHFYDCPARILNKLSDTDSRWAMQWRNKCRAQNR